MIDPERIMLLAWTVHADANLNAILAEHLDPFGVQQSSVCLDIQFQMGYMLENLASAVTPSTELPRSNQAWLATMK